MGIDPWRHNRRKFGRSARSASTGRRRGLEDFAVRRRLRLCLIFVSELILDKVLVSFVNVGVISMIFHLATPGVVWGSGGPLELPGKLQGIRKPASILTA